VGAFNSGIVVQNRAGDAIASVSLGQFWTDQASNAYYDPRIAYDAVLDRWITVAINDEQSLMLAVSANGDPTGLWTRYELGLGATGGGIDFSRLALTRDTIVIVTERVSYSSCLIVSTQKADLYAGGQTIPVQVDDTRGSSSSVVPVATTDSDVDYLLMANHGGSMAIKRVDEAQWQHMTAPSKWEAGWFMASQRDTSNDLDFGLSEVQNAVMRNGVIYAVQSVGVPATVTRPVVMWWKIDPAQRTVIGQGIIDDGKTFYGYPSIAVNRAGALIAYAVVSNAEYASSRFVFMDAAGKFSNEAKLKDGTSTIRDTDRWGDYTTTVADPLDDTAFWTVQISAQSGHWQTWWARVKAPAAASRRRSARH